MHFAIKKKFRFNSNIGCMLVITKHDDFKKTFVSIVCKLEGLIMGLDSYLHGK